MESVNGLDDRQGRPGPLTRTATSQMKTGEERRQPVRFSSPSRPLHPSDAHPNLTSGRSEKLVGVGPLKSSFRTDNCNVSDVIWTLTVQCRRLTGTYARKRFKMD